MSIIYDALQKSQKKVEKTRENISVKKIPEKKTSLLFVFILSCLTLIGAAYFSIVHYPHKPLSPPIKPVVINTKPLALNGVFVSHDYKTAIINNRYVLIGDMIEGRKVLDIALDGVRLLDDGHVVVLHAA